MCVCACVYVYVHGRHLVGDMGDMSPHFWQWGHRIGLSDVPHPLFGMAINHVFQYLSAFSLYPYSDILSMYSIYRIRRNRNQSLNDIHFPNIIQTCLGGGGG